MKFEIANVLDNIENTIKHLKNWMKDESVNTPLLCAPAFSRIHHDPYGVVLVISAWNYPVFTLFEPLVSAIAGGNVALLKPSEVSPATSVVLRKMVGHLDQKYFKLVEGGPEIGSHLTKLKFDLISFTGGT